MPNIPRNSQDLGPIVISEGIATVVDPSGLGFGDQSLRRIQAATDGLELVTGGATRLRVGNGVGLAEFLITASLPMRQYVGTVAALNGLALAAGTTAYATNGRKAGEGAGAGTGVLAFRDASNWIACDTGAVLSA